MATVLKLACMYADLNGSTIPGAMRAVNGMATSDFNNLQAWIEREGMAAAFAALAYHMPNPAYAKGGLDHLRKYVG